MATVLWGALQTADAPTWTTLASLASGSYALSTAIDNTSGLFEQAMFDLALPSAVTCGAGAPYVGLTILPSPDGTNYPTPPGATAGATGIPQIAAIPGVASASFTRSPSGIFMIPPTRFKLLLLNNLGVAFPASGTFTASLYRFAETVA